MEKHASETRKKRVFSGSCSSGPVKTRHFSTCLLPTVENRAAEYAFSGEFF
jgi:hypothetical protein